MTRRLLHILIALDQLAYVLLTLGDGMPDETVSAALYRMEIEGKRAGRWLRPLVDWLFWPVDPYHCQTAYASERQGLHNHRSYRANT
jgi:hypothetical protein